MSRKSFDERIDRSGGPNACWPWMARRDPNGYGRFDKDYKPQLAHRIAYFHANPSSDKSLKVCHRCDNPPCCNPAHLWLGTQTENVADMDTKGRGRRVTRRGEASNKAKLTAEQAIEIFNSAETIAALGARFGISTTAVKYIKTGRNWAHVTGARNAA